MELNEIKEILENHAKYLINKKDGKRANFQDADLRGIDFRNVDLREADFQGADLRGANFSEANLSKANFYRANLRGANFFGADLSGADLFDAKLCGAFLFKTNLQRANLFGVDLSGADLSKANLCEANLCSSRLYGALLYKAILCEANLRITELYGANFDNTDLCGADLFGTNLSESVLRKTYFTEAKNVSYIPMACPDTGSFVAWKKAGKYIVKLLIPDDAKRSSANGRKCRADKAKVLEIQNIDGGKADINWVASNFDGGFIYEVGQEVTVPNFEKNRFIECAPGIHFFINQQEAIDYDW